jgi:hypothetical protein
VPKNNRGNRRSNNNNPEGYNQFNSGWMDTARERPVAAAGLAAAAVGASVFLWSRRSQISEQLSNLSDQIGEWNENMGSRGGSEDYEMAGSESSFSGSTGGSSGNQFGGSGMSGSGTSGSTGSGMSGGSGMGTTTGSTGSGMMGGSTGSNGGKRGGKGGNSPS